MSYNIYSKLIHWVMGIIITVMLILGFCLDDLPTENKAMGYMIHKSTGLLLLMMVAIRLIMRATSKYPTLPESTPKIIGYIAKLNLLGLYLIMILMPLSGLLMSTLSGRPVPFYGLFQLESLGNNPTIAEMSYNFHGIGGYIFIVLIIAHVLGGLFHHFVLKDDVLRRML